ncbi:MAG: hypothetical protein SWQ30_06600 [Thermodesulfobacteriota bacterium]|nr:hypothetical protein [Thermodesulfobacteriota bacterium]
MTEQTDDFAEDVEAYLPDDPALAHMGLYYWREKDRVFVNAMAGNLDQLEKYFKAHPKTRVLIDSGHLFVNINDLMAACPAHCARLFEIESKIREKILGQDVTA